MNHFCVFLLLLMNLIDEPLQPQNLGPSRAHPRPQAGAAVHLAAPAWLARNFVCKWVFSVALHGMLVLQLGHGWGGHCLWDPDISAQLTSRRFVPDWFF